MPKLGVCAGQQRLAALDLLCEKGRITKDYLVPVLNVSEGEALATSLIENRTTRDVLVSNADDMADSVAWKALESELSKWARMLPKRTD